MADAPDASFGVTMEEMEAHEAATKEPEAPVEADDTLKPPVIDQTTAYKEALRISEEARQRVEKQLETTNTPASAPRAPDPIAEMTDEQLEALIEEKGVAAGVRAIQAQTFRLADQHLERRLGAIVSSGASTAENAARAKYPMEFELFGDQIMDQIAKTPDKSVLGNPEVWANLIGWVRGKDGNLDTYIERRSAGASEAAATTARAAQVANAGAHVPSGGAPPKVVAGSDEDYGLDKTEMEIASTLNLSPKEYARWKKVN